MKIQDILQYLIILGFDSPLSAEWLYEILQARIQGGKKKIQGGPIPFSRGSSQPKDQTQVSCITGRFFTREALDVSSKC